jgi:hypothetical protein
MKKQTAQSFTNKDFIKSSSCVYPPGGCVEVAIKGKTVAVRDAKNPAQPMLLFTKAEWTAFVQGVKAGEFDTR